MVVPSSLWRRSQHLLRSLLLAKLQIHGVQSKHFSANNTASWRISKTAVGHNEETAVNLVSLRYTKHAGRKSSDYA